MVFVHDINFIESCYDGAVSPLSFSSVKNLYNKTILVCLFVCLAVEIDYFHIVAIIDKKINCSHDKKVNR